MEGAFSKAAADGFNNWQPMRLSIRRFEYVCSLLAACSGLSSVKQEGKWH